MKAPVKSGAKVTFNPPRPVPRIKAKPLPPIPVRPGGVTQAEVRDLEKQEKKEEQSLWDMFGDVLNLAGRKALQYGIRTLTGFGDYQVNSNSLLAAATEGKNGYTVPIMSNSKVGTIIRHREYIQDVPGSVAFSLTSFSINPGLDTTFPWASPVSNCYSNYRMRGMMFEFVSLATDYAAVQGLGYVVMATQYNSLLPIFVDKKTMENSEYANSTKPSVNMCHPVECAPGELSISELYVRSGVPPTNADLRLYDLGTFSIATGGQSGSATIGELWVTYEMELYFPILSGTNQTIQGNHFNALIANWTNANPLTTSSVTNWTPDPTNNMAVLCVGNLVTFGQDSIGTQFRVRIFWQSNGGGITWVPPTITIAGDTVLLVGPIACPFSGALVSTRCDIVFSVQGGNLPVSFTIGGAGTLPTFGAGFNANITIDEVPFGSLRAEDPLEELLSEKRELLGLDFSNLSEDELKILRKLLPKSQQ